MLSEQVRREPPLAFDEDLHVEEAALVLEGDLLEVARVIRERASMMLKPIRTRLPILYPKNNR